MAEQDGQTPEMAAQSQNSQKPGVPDATKTEPQTISDSAPDKNVFGELFGQSGESGLMNAVAENSEAKKKKSYFVDRSGLKFSRDKAKEKSKRQSQSQVGKHLLRFSVFLAFASGIFFTTQNNLTLEWFRNNPAQKAIAAEELVELLDAQISMQKHLGAALELEQFMVLSDAYFYNLGESESEFNSQNARSAYADRAEDLKPEILALVAGIQEGLSDNLSPDEVAQTQDVIDESIGQYAQNNRDVDRQVILQDIQDFESSKALVADAGFKAYISGLDAENLSDDEILEVAARYGQINRNVNTIIAEIRASRQDWSELIDEVESVVKSIDPLFNTDFPGSLSLSSLVFSGGNTVSLSGSSSTDDSKNFTVIANLVDAFESSDFFANVAQRSFSKSSSSDESYKGSFNLNMDLTQPNE